MSEEMVGSSGDDEWKAREITRPLSTTCKISEVQSVSILLSSTLCANQSKVPPSSSHLLTLLAHRHMKLAENYSCLKIHYYSDSLSISVQSRSPYTVCS